MVVYRSIVFFGVISARCTRGENAGGVYGPAKYGNMYSALLLTVCRRWGTPLLPNFWIGRLQRDIILQKVNPKNDGKCTSKITYTKLGFDGKCQIKSFTC